MIKPKFFIFASVFLFALNAVFAQTDVNNKIEPSYEVILNVVVASNNANDKGKLSPSLSGVVGKLKNDYTFTNYSLAATFFERISQTGEIYHSGILNQLKQEDEEKFYFSNWSLKGLKTGLNTAGKSQIQFNNFIFGAKVPVAVSTIANGDGSEIVNYENIGITINRFNQPENTPTIVGSLAAPKFDEFIFLILTVRPV